MSATQDAVGPEASSAGDLGLYKSMYRQMVLIRRFEEATQKAFRRGQVYGSVHLCIGQEAVAVGAASVLKPQDWIAATFRGHGHALAAGTAPEGLFAEMLGRKTGTSGGRSGSMNVVDHKHHLIGCFAIVGGTIAAATGAALTLSRSADRGVAVAFVGDGSVNQAYFYECLNMAKVLSLPLLCVCENNQYGEFTPFSKTTPGGITARPAAMEIPAEKVDGMDVWAVRDAVASALGRIRAGGGPAFLEASTYRFVDHARGDPIDYRGEGEMERWRERDPLKVAHEKLGSTYGVATEELDSIAQDAQQEVNRIAEAALEAPFPESEISGSEFKAGG